MFWDYFSSDPKIFFLLKLIISPFVIVLMYLMYLSLRKQQSARETEPDFHDPGICSSVLLVFENTAV